MKRKRTAYKRTVVAGALLLGLGLPTAAVVGRRDGLAEGARPVVLPTAGARWDMPVTRNAQVETWITYLRGRNRDRTELWLQRSGRYAPMIRQALRRRGMPEDLVYLAFIESGFSPSAYSPARAAGIWQFIAETGRRYGLEVSSYVDERRDPLKATTAALDYLQKLHGQFGDWYLAAAAYNAGENRVARILREQREDARGNDTAFWRIAPYLPQETRDYVPLMLAAGHIGKEPEKYGFMNLDYQVPLTFEVVTVPGGTRLSAVAHAIKLDADDVEELNPHLIRRMTPPGRLTAVRIPAGHAAVRVAFRAPR
jgi:membrane-bound lytic murein transglycosylase D